MVANIDQVILVAAAAKPHLSWHLVDRILVSAESTEIPALICLTKMDLVEGHPQADEIEAVAAEYRAIGYEAVLTSTVTGRGLEDLKSRLHGRLSALIGHRGWQDFLQCSGTRLRTAVRLSASKPASRRHVGFRALDRRQAVPLWIRLHP
jgi:hypothetical protein